MIRHLLLILSCLLLAAPPGWSMPPVALPPAKCTLIYTLDGETYRQFNQQVDRLSPHIRSQRMQLVDINHWRSHPPHIEISGRQRKQLRQQFNLADKQDTVVLADRHGNVHHRQLSTTDLVDMLMRCKSL